MLNKYDLRHGLTKRKKTGTEGDRRIIVTSSETYLYEGSVPEQNRELPVSQDPRPVMQNAEHMITKYLKDIRDSLQTHVSSWEEDQPVNTKI